MITGHYGSGKTNFSINLAVNLADSGQKVTIVDLDLVNPYFRTADFKELLEEKGISVITPNFANTNLDVPSIPSMIYSVFDRKDGAVIIDVGGDDAGATALGQFFAQISNTDYDLYYVLNAYRYLTQTPAEAVSLLRDIEYSSRLKATKLINNSNLGLHTTKQQVEETRSFAEAVSAQTGLPIAFTCMDRQLNPDEKQYFPVELYVKSIWDEPIE